MQNKTSNDPLTQLKNLQLQLLSKAELLALLNSEYRNKQQKQFLGTFLHIMNQMSTQLANARQQYQNIDTEIQKDQQCKQLSMKLTFFQNQCLVLKDQLHKTQYKLIHNKNKQKQLIIQKQLLQQKLLHKQKQIFKYKAKARNFSLEKIQQSINHIHDPKNIHKILSKEEIYQQGNKNIKNKQITETSNTDTQTVKGKLQNPRNFSATQNQFNQKVTKLAKQRKSIMNHTYFTTMHSNNNNQFKKSNLLSQILK